MFARTFRIFCCCGGGCGCGAAAVAAAAAAVCFCCGCLCCCCRCYCTTADPARCFLLSRRVKCAFSVLRALKELPITAVALTIYNYILLVAGRAQKKSQHACMPAIKYSGPSLNSSFFIYLCFCFYHAKILQLNHI